ncbi:MAG: gliding motility-associated C-terminal domain-containing protein [Flavobacteriales bacterium]|nr:gliding motility-associated C-terminal domain-containing protein [Flavobacteriales bacterium]
MHLKFLFIAVLLAFSVDSISQCIVINEIMINGPGPNDGSGAPYTEEWIELYNTCDTPVDIGCYVIADGDFTITIPASTIMAPHAYFVLGSQSSGLTLDLNWAECGCANGTGIGIFTNGNEQVLLSDATGTISDALQWGNGQFPLNATSTVLGACSALNFNYTSNSGEFEILPDGGGNGCSMARACDGSLDWAEFCDTSPTPGASNGALNPEVNFESSETSLCVGECISFQDLSSITANGWEWQFEGADTPVSSDQNPANVCYSTPGVYDVTLTLNTSCGSFSFTSENMVTVGSTEIPTVTYSGPTTFCEGSSLLLQTTSIGSYQWNLNGDPIQGATENNYTVTTSGNYSLTLINGSCEGESTEVAVEVIETTPAILTPTGPIDICTGETVMLTVNDAFESYNWYQDGQLLVNTTDSSLEVNTTGTYYVEAINGTCPSNSNNVVVNVLNQLSVSITPSPSITICVGNETELIATSGFSTYEWYQNGSLIATQSNPNYTTNGSGDYQVVAISGNCTATSAVTTVTVVNPPVVSIVPSNNITLCSGESIDLTATAGFSNYVWTQNDTPIGFTQVLEVSSEGEYTVTVSENGCTATAIVQVNVSDLIEPIIISSNDQFIFCIGSSLTLSTSTGYDNYQWYYNDNPIGTSSSISVNAEGNYYVVVSTGNCEGISQTVDVQEVQLPFITINPSGTVEVCGNQATLYATGAADLIQWLYNSNPIVGENGGFLDVTNSGNYQVLASTVNGCTALSNTVFVELITPIDVNVSSSSQEGCEGDPVTLTASGNFESYQWSTGNTGTTILVTQNGQYAVTVTDGPCTVVETINVNLNPIPLVYAGLDTIADCNIGVTLFGSGEGILQWEQDGTIDLPESAITPVHPEHTTIYTLTATLDGCTAEDQVVVFADCEVVEAPNIFTPNGDGKNDTFEVKVFGIASYDVKIFDRWGVLVFESSDPDNQWTGSVNGRDASEGTYYYIIEAIRFDGQPYQANGIKGSVTLLR